MSTHSPTSIVPQHRTHRENRPVRVGLSEVMSCEDSSVSTPTVRLLPDSLHPRAIEVVCPCGQRMEIELLFPEGH